MEEVGRDLALDLAGDRDGLWLGNHITPLDLASLSRAQWINVDDDTINRHFRLTSNLGIAVLSACS